MGLKQTLNIFWDVPVIVRFFYGHCTDFYSSIKSHHYIEWIGNCYFKKFEGSKMVS